MRAEVARAFGGDGLHSPGRMIGLQFIAFVAVSAIAASTTLVSRYFLSSVVLYEIAVVLSQLVGMFVAFTLVRQLVFAPSAKPRRAQFLRFAIVNLGSLVIATGVSSIAYRAFLPALDVTFYPDVIAQIIGLGACSIPSFLGHKLFSFRAQSR